MLRRGSACLTSRLLLWIGRGLMASNCKLTFSKGFCWSTQCCSEPPQLGRPHWKVLVGRGTASAVSAGNAATSLSLRSCLDRHHRIFGSADDEMGRARSVAPYPRLACDPEAVVAGEEVGVKAVNGYNSSKHGRTLGFPDKSVPEKLVVAVDVDEVLGSFLFALNKFIAERYSLSHSLSEYYVYEFFKIWNCSRAEANIRVHEFFKTAYFTTGIHPIPGARHTLHKLSRFCKLSVVTSRQDAIKDQTLEWIAKHYPGLFQEIHFGNHFALDGQSRPKSEICASMGARVLIDDNPGYALECAEAGIRVLLFDYENSYPWCKTASATSHPLVTRVHNWHQVERHLLAWALPC